MLWELYGRYGDTWLVALLYDDLKDWSDWFHESRRLAPLNLTALGGDDMQAARYESGLDNSPMCACPPSRVVRSPRNGHYCPTA